MTPTWDHQDPAECRAEASKELSSRYKINTIVDEKVMFVKKTGQDDYKFVVVDDSGKEWSGKKLVLATGVSDVCTDIKGYVDRWVTGTFHCTYFHGYKDRTSKSTGIIVVDLFSMVMSLVDGAIRNALQFTHTITVYTNGSVDMAEKIRFLLAKRAVKHDTRRIRKLVKEPMAAEITIQSGEGNPVTVSFVVHTPKMVLNLDYAKELTLERAPTGLVLKANFPSNETPEPGCFAAGDMTSFAKVMPQAVISGGFAAVGVVKQSQADP